MNDIFSKKISGDLEEEEKEERQENKKNKEKEKKKESNGSRECTVLWIQSFFFFPFFHKNLFFLLLFLLLSLSFPLMSHSLSPNERTSQRKHQVEDTNFEYEELLKEANATDLRDYERTHCITTGIDEKGHLILLFIPRIGFEGTNLENNLNETQKMRKMFLLFIQIAEKKFSSSSSSSFPPYSIVYGHSSFSMLNQYTLFREFHSKLPKEKYKKNLKQFIILFMNLSLKLALDFSRIFRIVKPHFFSSKLVTVEDIASLQKIIPPTCLEIPPGLRIFNTVN